MASDNNSADRETDATRERLKIAWLSPFPPQRSGIANYSYWLVKSLKSHVDIHLFAKEEVTPELAAEFVVHPLSSFPDLRKEYDDSIYHLGNHAGFHKQIYEFASHFPATIVLHDYNISGFMHDAFYLNSLYQQAAHRMDRAIRSSNNADHGAPMSHAIVERSRKVIVHHKWARDQFPDHPRIEVIPHFAQVTYAPTKWDISRFKEKFNLRDDHFIIVCLGFLNSNKLPELQIETSKRLLREGYPVHLVFAGEPAPEVLELLVRSKLDGYSDNVICTGYLDDVDYFSAIYAADVIVNLRNPTMGESSGTLAHALAAGRPTIVSDMNQYREFPHSVCWKLTHDSNETDLLFEYLAVLLREPNLRRAMSANAIDFAHQVLGLDKVAQQWLRTLTSR